MRPTLRSQFCIGWPRRFAGPTAGASSTDPQESADRVEPLHGSDELFRPVGRRHRSSARTLVSMGALAGLILTVCVPEALAQPEADTGFSIERYVPAPGPGAFWAVEGSEVLPHGAWWFGADTSLMSRPLVLQHLMTGESQTTPVRVRYGLDLMAALGFSKRYQLGAALPIIAAQDGQRLRGIDLDERALAPMALGDVRLYVKMRLWGRPDGLGGALAATAYATVPTGDEDHFAGERGALFGWNLIGSWRRSGFGAVGFNLGPRTRMEEVVLLSPARPHGNEFLASAALEWFIPGLERDQLSIVAEYARVQALQSPMSSHIGPSPEEARLGIRWRFASGAIVGSAVGFGTTPSEVGSPALRWVTSIQYSNHPFSDLDEDGIPDHVDRCRMRSEDRDGFNDTDGCPDPDNDGDGIVDEDDRCPDDPENLDGYRDLDGCPETRGPDRPIRRPTAPPKVPTPSWW